MGSERYITLRISCPAVNCTNKQISSWAHSDDQCPCYPSNMEISTRANVKCSYCGDPSHLIYCRFSCSKHDGEYRKIKLSRFTRAVSIAQQTRAMDSDFSDELVKHLADEEETGFWDNY